MSKDYRACKTCGKRKHYERFVSIEAVRCDQCKLDRKVSDDERVARQGLIERPDYSKLNGLWLSL